MAIALIGIVLAGSTLVGSTLVGSTLVGSTLSGSTLVSSTLVGSTLDGTGDGGVLGVIASGSGALAGRARFGIARRRQGGSSRIRRCTVARAARTRCDNSRVRG